MVGKRAMAANEKPVVRVPRAYRAGDVMLVVMPGISRGREFFSPALA
jgi:hypothetical protein